MADEPGVQVQVVGFDQLVTDLGRMTERVAPAAGAAMLQAAQNAADRARSLTPVDTGQLAGSIVSGSDHQGRAYLEMGVGVPYAGWIEYGGTRGRPYVAQGRSMYPSGVAVTPQAVDAAARQTQHEIEGYPWTRPKT